MAVDHDEIESLLPVAQPEFGFDADGSDAFNLDDQAPGQKFAELELTLPEWVGRSAAEIEFNGVASSLGSGSGSGTGSGQPFRLWRVDQEIRDSGQFVPGGEKLTVERFSRTIGAFLKPESSWPVPRQARTQPGRRSGVSACPWRRVGIESPCVVPLHLGTTSEWSRRRRKGSSRAIGSSRTRRTTRMAMTRAC